MLAIESKFNEVQARELDRMRTGQRVQDQREVSAQDLAMMAADMGLDPAMPLEIVADIFDVALRSE